MKASAARIFPRWRRWIALGAWFSIALSAHGQSSARPPNVLFVAVDDLNAQLGCMGAEVLTPHLDRLARSGMLFERAYCQEAVCGPSRASVLSGLRPDGDTPRIGRGGGGGDGIRRLFPRALLLPELFKNHGYYTVSLGKIFHHGEVETGGDIGPRMTPDPKSWSETPWYHGSPYQQWYNSRSWELVRQMRALPEAQRPRIIRGMPYESSPQPDEVYADGQIASQAVLTLRRLHEQAQPFFLAVGFRRPHLPFNCPQKYWDLYPAESIRLPANHHPPKDVPPIALHDAYELRSYAAMPATGALAEEDVRNLIRGYRACVSYVDAQIGRVLTELERLGLAQNTLVVVWSDHGYHLGENGLWTKMSNFEQGTHVPLIFRVPGRGSPGSRSRALVELVDIYPTLAELCGLTAPSHLEGTSLVPLFERPDQPWKSAAFSYYRRSPDWTYDTKTQPLGRSMMTDRYHYVEWTLPNGQRVGTELYDHQMDKLETANLAGRPEQRALVEQLSRQLAAGWSAARPRKPRRRDAWSDWTLGRVTSGRAREPHVFRIGLFGRSGAMLWRLNAPIIVQRPSRGKAGRRASSRSADVLFVSGAA